MTATIGIDLGGTKLSVALIQKSGEIIHRSVTQTAGKKGKEVGSLIISEISKVIELSNILSFTVSGIGICVPGIYHKSTGKVWAPNIKGWDDYPLLEELNTAFSGTGTRILIDSDRTCYIVGETWLGAAKGSNNAIYLSVGTGIGAGIICDGHIIRGHGDIAGAVGWMALSGNFDNKYTACGCFEYHASGAGIVKSANEDITNNFTNAQEIFNSYDNGNIETVQLLQTSIKMWGMAAANLVSIFNPEILIFGGGLFGPAAQFLPQIKNEAELWAQPLAMRQVSFRISSLGGDAGLIGAGRLAFINDF